MARKDKLYTVNKFNRPAFMPKENLFLNGGDANQAWDKLASKTYGARYGDEGFTLDNYKQDKGNNWFGLTKEQNPLSAGNIATAIQGINPTSALAGVAGAAGEVIGGAAYKGISGGLSSGAGKAIQGVTGGLGNIVGGVPIVGGLAKGALNLVGGVVGGVTNALVGTKVDQKKLHENRAGTSAYNNFTSNATSLDAISGPTAQANVQDAYSGGAFKKGWARRNNAQIKEDRIDARQFAFNSVENNANNLVKDQLNDALANYSAFGGPIDFNDRNMGAIEYGFMSDYLDNGKEKAESKNKITNLFAGVPSSLFADGGGIHIKHPGRLTALKEKTGKTEAELWAEGSPEVRKMITFARNSRKWHADGGPLFAFGGDMATNSSDWSTGLMHIDAGGSHSENPYDGVQIGTDSEGTPNLVEENEVIFNDYVFSNRINIDATTKEKFHLPKKKDITYADLAKRLEKEISERVNDPISKSGFKAQMQTLEEQQERQKQEMEAQRAKEAFESLSPEEQVAVMDNAAKQEAMAQQAAQEQQLAAEQQAAMQQQAQMQADGTEAMLGQEAPMMAEGGHLYADGSKLRKGIYNALGFHTDNDFLEWARKNKLRGDDKWEATEDMLKSLAEDDEAWKALIKDPTFAEAIKDNPALVDAISRGYDFGAYKPLENGKATIKSISRGNWKATNGAGWLGSDDPAWLEATKGMSEEDIKKLSTEDVAKLMRATNSYKKGTEWLQNKDNALLYLNTLLNDADTPQVAKDYAAKFVKDGQWKDGFNYDYATVFGSNGKGVRETNPGTYWHTPVEATRSAQAQNWVINDDGSVEEIIGEVPTNWTAAGNYSWATPENDLTYNYYRRPAATATPKTPEEIEAEKKAAKQLERKIVPIHNNTLFGIEDLGPLGAMGLMAAGVGKPDTASLDAAASSAGNVHLADYKPIGDYLTYRPMDIWYEQNALNAQSRATDRALLNSTSPSRMAGLLANGYNSQLASGDLYRKALEYNDAQRERVAGFNRGTNQFNAEAYNRNSQFNAAALNDAVGRSTNARLHAAQTKLDADAGWYNSLYGNLNSINQNIAARRKENRQRNMIADMAAAGIYGVINPDTFNPNSMLRWETDEEYQKRLAQQGKKACGGKMKKGKRGLTF